MRPMPILEWVPGYRRANLPGDLTAGLTGAALLIPQSMAYAQLGGVPPVVGLYASVIPAFAYACFGRSRQLTVGPLSTIAIIGALAVSDLAVERSEDFVAMTATLAVLVGVVGIVLAIARVGSLMRYVRKPIITGFLAGAAIVIMANQLDELFGYHTAVEPRVSETIARWAEHLDETNVTGLVVGIVGIVGLFVTKRFGRLPSALIYIVGATVVVAVAGLDVEVVGHVPSGIAGFSVPTFEWDVVRSLAPAAVVILLVAYVESFGVASGIAEKHGDSIEANRELFAIGTTNVTSGFFAGMPSTGVPSRSAVLDQAGARTQLAALVGAAVVIPILLLGASLLEDIPMSALAAVVIVSISSFLRVAEFRRMWTEARFDFWIAFTAFVAIVMLGLEWGVIVTIGIAIIDAFVGGRRPTRLDPGGDPQ